MHAMAQLVNMKDDEPIQPEPEPEPEQPRKFSFLSSFRQKMSSDDLASRTVSVKSDRAPADSRTTRLSIASAPLNPSPSPTHRESSRTVGQKFSGVFGLHSKKGFTKLEES